MWPRTSCPLSSWTLNIVFGRASTISPSISIFSSLGTADRDSDEADVHRLRPLVPGLFLVLDLRVFGEGLEPLAVDTRVVDEKVPVAIVRRDESVTLLVVEPLNGSGRHVMPLPACAPRSVLQSEPEVGTLHVATTPVSAGPTGRQPTRGDGRAGANLALSTIAQPRCDLLQLVLSRRFRPPREPQAIVAPARQDVDVEVEDLLV